MEGSQALEHFGHRILVLPPNDVSDRVAPLLQPHPSFVGLVELYVRLVRGRRGGRGEGEEDEGEEGNLEELEGC